MKKNFPLTLIIYLIKEFLASLFIVYLVFFSLTMLISFVEELTFFKEKNLDNLIWTISYLSIVKTPNIIIEMSIFIFLFAGILFFVKIQKNNEMNVLLLSGISKSFPILTLAFISFFWGIFLIIFLSPISSGAMKFYEQSKRFYSSNDNLIFISDNGLWFMENINNNFNIIRADKISSNNFSRLNNVTIYNMDNNFNFIKRMDSKVVVIKKKNWILEKTKILYNLDNSNLSEKKEYNTIDYLSSININDLKDYFSNSSTVSFWDILNNIKNLNERGYSADELKVKYHKYLSLPIYLFCIIFLSTTFTILIDKKYNTLIYLFFGLIVGFFLYFLNDLSITLGLANKIPLTISIWAPVMVLLFFSVINILKINEN